MKKIKGVTLLEVLLVLAIASMIIVMSVRYYQSATANQQSNSALQFIQAITVAADGLALGTNSYSKVSTNSIQLQMPNNSLSTPWGGTATVEGTPERSSYTVQLTDVPSNVCTQLLSRLQANSKYSTTSVCAQVGKAADFEYTYDARG